MHWLIWMTACHVPEDLETIDPATTGTSPAPTCPATSGTLCAWAGQGYNGFNGDDQPRLETWLSFPLGVAFPPAPGLPVLADRNNHALRQVEDDPLDGLDTLSLGGLQDLNRSRFDADGLLWIATDRELATWDPVTDTVQIELAGVEVASDVLVDPKDSDQVYFLESGRGRVQRLDRATGLVSTILDDLGTERVAFEPQGALAISEDAEILYVADAAQHAVRAVDLITGQTTLLAGALGEEGLQDGPAAARFHHPNDLALDPVTGTLLVADTDNHRIRAIDLATGTVSTVAGTGSPTCADLIDLRMPAVCEGQMVGSAGDGGPALQATLYRPMGIDLDAEGNLIISDTFDHRLRIVYR